MGEIMLKKDFMRLSLILILILANCAYYNTYYNAEKFFNEAAKEREKRKTDKPTAGELQNYKKAIEKASRLLEFYPDSKYVDDALMMLGKCFFYQEEYHKAVRKFNELMEYDPNSEYIAEARLWLGKSYTRLQDFENAMATFRQITNSDASQKIKDESLLLVGELHFEREDYASAAQEFDIAAQKIKNKKIRNRAGFLMGQSFFELGEYEKALQSFQIALKASYDEETENEALANIALCHKKLNDHQEAMEVLSNLLGKDSYEEYWPLSKVEMAECIYKSGNVEEAMEWYYSIIEDHPRTEASARAYYNLGKIYEINYVDYDSAYANYDRVQSQYRRATVSDTAQLRMNDIVDLLSLIEVIKVQETGKRSNLEFDYEDEEVLDDTTRFRLKVKRTIRKLVRFRTRQPHVPLPDTLIADSLLADSLRLDTLWNKLPDEWGKGLVISKRWGIRDTVNVADLAKYGYIPADEDRDVQFEDQEEESYKKKQQQNNSPRQKMKTQIAKFEKNDLVKNKLNLAELYLVKFGLYDSSLIHFKQILEMKPDSNVVNITPHVLYTMAYIYEKVKQDSITADSMYRELAENFSQTPQGKKARQILKLPPLKQQKDPAIAEFSEAEKIYIVEKNLDEAIRRFGEIGKKYPDSEIAAKSLYAAGFIFDMELNENEKATELYNQILEKYPKTEYAQAVKRKLDAVKKEEARLEAEAKKKAEADSLAAIKAMAPDSTASDSTLTPEQIENLQKQQAPQDTSETKLLQTVEADSNKMTAVDSVRNEESEISKRKREEPKLLKEPEVKKGKDIPKSIKDDDDITPPN